MRAFYSISSTTFCSEPFSVRKSFCTVLEVVLLVGPFNSVLIFTTSSVSDLHI